MFAILKQLAENEVAIYGDGVLEVSQDGYGFRRSPEANNLPGPDDIYVSPSQIRRFSLRTGSPRSIGMPVRIPALSCGRQDEAGLADLASRCSYGRTRTIGTFRVLGYDDILAIYQLANNEE